MPHAQSNIARQLISSLDFVKSLPASFNSPYAIAKRSAENREREISRMEKIIADESEHLPNSVTYRDGFCYECETNEYILGTARQLAVKLYDLGWVAPSVRRPHLNCLKCQEVE